MIKITLEKTTGAIFIWDFKREIITTAFGEVNYHNAETGCLNEDMTDLHENYFEKFPNEMLLGQFASIEEFEDAFPEYII